MRRRALTWLLVITTPMLLGVGIVRVIELREEREIRRNIRDLEVRDAVRGALLGCGLPAARFDSPESLARQLAAGGHLDKEVADYVEKNRERFAVDAHRKEFEVSWFTALGTTRLHRPSAK